MAPLVTVLMPMRNAGRYVREALVSVLSQTMHDFELIAIDDGSTDDTWERLGDYEDSRLVPIRQRHKGLVPTLNYGLEVAEGSYIARMDADDVALPDRLRKQVDFMEANQEVALLGSSLTLIDEEGEEVGVRDVAVGRAEIRWEALLENPFMHSTVMLRREVVRSRGFRYDEEYHRAEDYELWTQMLALTEAANLPDRLVRYRLHGDSSSALEPAAQLESLDRVAYRTIRYFLPEFDITEEQVRLLEMLLTGATAGSEELDGIRLALADLYFDMFETFREKYPEMTRMPPRGAAKLARGLTHGRGERGWSARMFRLIKMSPGLAGFVLENRPKARR